MNAEIYNTIQLLADKYANVLQERMNVRMEEMQYDDTGHYLIYNVLGISNDEGRSIDIYQNKGRFLYKYAGTFLEEATNICFRYAYPDAEKMTIPNTLGNKPKTFEIDCVIGSNAYEIKWRDATTDGDHITKEHTRVQVIKSKGYIPIRVMFYYPQRSQAQKIQATLKTLYSGIGGQYYYGDTAWQYVKEYTGIDLMEILTSIASLRT